MIEGLPLPATDNPLDQPFWHAARDGRLVVQACGDCGEAPFPPRPMCPCCQSEEVQWIEDDGAATVWSFATPRPPLLPAFEAMLPYITVIGALRSNPAIRIAGMAIDAGGQTALDADAIAIGQPLCMEFHVVSESVALPLWRIAAGAQDAR